MANRRDSRVGWPTSRLYKRLSGLAHWQNERLARETKSTVEKTKRGHRQNELAECVHRQARRTNGTCESKLSWVDRPEDRLNKQVMDKIIQLCAHRSIYATRT